MLADQRQRIVFALIGRVLRALAESVPMPMPVLVAAVRVEQGGVVETGRGFIVPGNGRARAAFRQKLAATQP